MPAFIATSDYKICKPGTMHALAYSYETGVPKKTRLRKLLTQEEKIRSYKTGGTIGNNKTHCRNS
jgi:hypothetical protein